MLMLSVEAQVLFFKNPSDTRKSPARSMVILK
jgi:hypothetical protein